MIHGIYLDLVFYIPGIRASMSKSTSKVLFGGSTAWKKIRATQASPWVDSPAIWKYLYKYDNIARGLIYIYTYVCVCVCVFYTYIYIYIHMYIYIIYNVCRHIYLYGLIIWVMRTNEVCIGTKRNDFSDQSTAAGGL